MAKKPQSDSGRFVILHRETKKGEWKLAFIVDARKGNALEMAWREAHSIDSQEATLGNSRHECIVVSEQDYDDKNIRPVKPPRDFDFALPLEDFVPSKGVVTIVPKAQASPPAERRVNPLLETVEKQEPTPVSPVVTPPLAALVKQAGRFPVKKCQYCSGDVPSNGAAQFSHLRKHVNELLARGALTQDQAAKIRSVTLSPEISEVFAVSYGGASSAQPKEILAS